ncbi:TPA: hypothetical protein ACGUTS_003902 [Vibrio vulnificus]
MMIRVLPDSKAVDALCICYERKRIYRHEGKEYYVVSLDVKGCDRETRLVAELEPVWSTEVMF